MSHRPCPACQHEGNDRTHDVPEVMFGTGERFTYVECSECRTLYIAVVPDNLGDYYGQNYYSFDFDPQAVLGKPGIRQVVGRVGRSVLLGNGRLAAAMGRLPNRSVAAMVRKFRSVQVAGLPRGKDTTILDVGTGTGVLVYALGLAGLNNVEGIDPFNAADIEFDTGSRVRKVELGDVQGTYDLVMLHHSLEHVTDPLTTLRETTDRLAEGGRVLVRMPTVSSHAYETYGLDYYGLDAPRHLTMFSREGVRRLAADAGLRIVTVKDDGNGVQFWASEQVRDGIPYASERSYQTSPRASSYTRSQIRAWDQQAEELNAAGRSDQAAWVLVRA